MISDNEQWNIENQVFNIIINQLPYYIFWKDINHVFRGCNQLHAEQFGLKNPTEIIGKRDHEFPWLIPYMDKYLADDKQVMESGKAKLHYEEAIHQRNGEPKVVLISKIPLVDNHNKVSGVLGIYTDITERKKMELELKASKEVAEAANFAKTEFMRNMSHDMRTPLTGIIGMADMISKKPSTQMTLEGADDIKLAGTALLNLLNEIIETVQAESGKTLQKKECFSLNQTIEKLTNIFKPAMKQKGLKLETYFDDNIPDILFGEELLFHRILLNLLGNAVKFTKKGSISLEVGLLRKRKETISLKIVVQDTGIGIRKDKQQMIFDKFSRLTPSYTNNFKGSGLGLFMVKEYIQRMGGDIKLKSSIGKGSTFTFVLDFQLPNASRIKEYKNQILAETAQLEKKQAAQKTKARKRKNTLRALLVEDTLLPRKLARSLLENEGYEVVVAETAREAFEKSQENRFDVIYMDLGLPDASGMDVTEWIRQDLSNPNVDTLIVALTAHSDLEIINKSISAGIQEIIDKPLSTDKINAIETKIIASLKKKKNKPAAKTNELPILDMGYMEKILGGNVNLARATLHTFIERLPQTQHELTDAFANQDFKKFQHHIHQLHGDLCYSGALRLKATVETLEQALVDQTGEYEALYEHLLDDIDALLKTVPPKSWPWLS